MTDDPRLRTMFEVSLTKIVARPARMLFKFAASHPMHSCSPTTPPVQPNCLSFLRLSLLFHLFIVHHQALNDIDTVDIAIDDLAGIARLGGKIVIDALQSKVVIPDFAKFKKGPFHTPYASMFAAVCHWVESTASAHPADVCG